jgi:drug/metabolite transporter (DMT)-like permease
MNPYFLIFGSAASYILGDFCAKNWGVKGNWFYLALTFTLYLFGGIMMILAIKKSSLSLAVSSVPLISIMAGITFGYFYFGERLSATQYLGVGIGICALTLILFPIKLLQ